MVITLPGLRMDSYAVFAIAVVYKVGAFNTQKPRLAENFMLIIVGLLHSASTILVGGLNKVTIAN